MPRPRYATAEKISYPVHDRVSIVANAQTTGNTSSSSEPDQFLTQSSSNSDTQVAMHASLLLQSLPQSFSSPYVSQVGTIIGSPPFQTHEIQCRFVYVLGVALVSVTSMPFLPPSPCNICIAHEEPRQITPSGKKPFITKSILHYHANPSCIWMNNTSFLPQSIEILPALIDKLDDNKKYYCKYI